MVRVVTVVDREEFVRADRAVNKARLGMIECEEVVGIDRDVGHPPGGRDAIVSLHHRDACRQAIERWMVIDQPTVL